MKAKAAKPLLRLSEKLQKMCTKLESEIEATEVTLESKLTTDQIRDRLSKKGWTQEEIDSLITKYVKFEGWLMISTG